MTMNAEAPDSIRAVLAPDGRSRSSEEPNALTLAASPSLMDGAMSGSVYRETWGRVFALVYDTAFALAERRGFRKVRQDLVGRARGRVVELGAGTGLNLDHYPESVTELHLTEPEPYMATRLRKRVDARSLHAKVVGAPAEDLPFDDHSVDTVVSTLVLCTVRDPHRAMAEIARVLRPGGLFLFAEHVRSASPRAARWQNRLNRPWGWYACGCHCNRDTVSTLRAASFQIGELTRDRLRWISPLVRPLVVGTASPSRAADASAVSHSG